MGSTSNNPSRVDAYSDAGQTNKFLFGDFQICRHDFDGSLLKEREPMDYTWSMTNMHAIFQ